MVVLDGNSRLDGKVFLDEKDFLDGNSLLDGNSALDGKSSLDEDSSLGGNLGVPSGLIGYRGLAMNDGSHRRCGSDESQYSNHRDG